MRRQIGNHEAMPVIFEPWAKVVPTPGTMPGSMNENEIRHFKIRPTDDLPF